MQKFVLSALFSVILSATSFAQKDSLTKAEKLALDSMMKNDQFLKLMNEKPKNLWEVSLGVGNGSFSSHNQAVNATGVANQVIFTPAVFYRFKTGFSLGVTAYVTSDSSKLEFYQTGITGAYDYVGKKVNAGISYTRFISDQNKYNSKSLYQNDLYAYIKKSSGVIEPLLAIGFSNGKYKEIDQIIFPPASGILRKDSTENKSSFFYTSIGIQHDFNWYKVFKSGDELDFVPAFVINAGSDKTTTVHTNKAFNNPNRPLLSRR